MKVIPDNAQALGLRTRQEDSFAFSSFENHSSIKTKGYLAIVADGMGGMSNGKEASQIAVQSFLDFYLNDIHSEGTGELLQNAIQKANEMVQKKAVEIGKEDTIGTTLVAAAIVENKLYWISVGDSRIYLYRKSELIQLTEDHNYAKFLSQEVLNGNMKKEDADLHPQKNALTSFLGLPFLSEIDFNVQPLQLEEGDIILLCSDGLHGFVLEEEISAVLQQKEAYSAQALIDFVLEKKHPFQDNVTVATLTCAAMIEQVINTHHQPHQLTPKQSSTKKWQLLTLLLLFTMIGIGTFFGIKYVKKIEWELPKIEWNPFKQEQEIENKKQLDENKEGDQK